MPVVINWAMGGGIRCTGSESIMLRLRPEYDSTSLQGDADGYPDMDDYSFDDTRVQATHRFSFKSFFFVSISNSIDIGKLTLLCESREQVLEQDRKARNGDRKFFQAQVGYFLMAVRGVPGTSKLLPTWEGLHQLIHVDSLSQSVISDILSGREWVMHPSRLARYHDGSCQVTEAMKQQAAHDRLCFAVKGVAGYQWRIVEDEEVRQQELEYRGSEASNEWLKYLRRLRVLHTHHAISNRERVKGVGVF